MLYYSLGGDTIVIVDNISKQHHKLKKLAKQSKRVLFSTSTVFPFDIFPNRLIIDENKVDFIYNNTFFLERKVFSVLLKNVIGVYVSTAWFLSTLRLEVKGFEENPTPMKYLWTSDAQKARRIILGLVAAHTEKTDLSQVPVPELTNYVEDIGRDKINPTV